MAVIIIRTRRRVPAVISVGAVLGVSLLALWMWTLPGIQRQAATPLQAPVAATAKAPDVLPPVVAVAGVSALAREGAQELLPPSPAKVVAVRAPTMSTPYRFIGRMIVNGESALIFFGRGRTITLMAPGPLDDEFVVDEIFDSQVLLRHVPTSTSKLIDLVTRTAHATAPASPDSYPQD